MIIWIVVEINIMVLKNHLMTSEIISFFLAAIKDVIGKYNFGPYF